LTPGGFATDETGSDFQKNFRRVQKRQKIFDVFSVNLSDQLANLFESPIVDELGQIL
jgi:hypothetical protein